MHFGTKRRTSLDFLSKTFALSGITLCIIRKSTEFLTKELVIHTSGKKRKSIIWSWR
ncbi:hypothetical protein PAXRUDRAFT_824305 [Paxillus rubicundulus Ve08.2h10]|uniref:Uncharacterized protein n=1 Tax=Paxillus rubicundulus Ve08.2h10 TaxID=930991 RepID=A0A0D0DIC7_9AGAM|nr:hypothetical protein PAXRUDRAFT_824305 [Paxillus rubicundulus Ve08.2h10]